MTMLSKPTIEILKNFCSINKSLVINPGNKLSTLSINKNILAIADVEEQFESQMSIYDLGVFLGGLSLFGSCLSLLGMSEIEQLHTAIPFGKGELDESLL